MGKRISSHVIATSTAADELHCGRLCTAVGACVAFSFDYWTGGCVGHDAKPGDAAAVVQSDAHFVTWKRM